MRSYDMTNKRFYILLKGFYAVYGRTPTLEEIEGYTDLDMKSIKYHLKKLENKGKVELFTRTITQIKMKEDVE